VSLCLSLTGASSRAANTNATAVLEESHAKLILWTIVDISKSSPPMHNLNSIEIGPIDLMPHMAFCRLWIGAWTFVCISHKVASCRKFPVHRHHPSRSWTFSYGRFAHSLLHRQLAAPEAGYRIGTRMTPCRLKPHWNATLKGRRVASNGSCRQ
jgi:hypothetical protein